MDHCLGGIGIGVIVLLYIRSGVVVKVLFGIAMLGTRANLPIEERGCLSAVVASLIIIQVLLCCCRRSVESSAIGRVARSTPFLRGIAKWGTRSSNFCSSASPCLLSLLLP